MNKLTDEQVQQISEALEENRSDNNKDIENLPSNNGVEERIPEDPNAYEKETINAYIDPMSGKENPIPEKIDPLHDINIDTDNFDELLNMSEDDIKKMDITDEEFKKNIPVISGLNKADIAAFKKVFDRYKRGENFSIYNSLPNAVKRYIDDTIASLDSNNFGKTKIQDMRAVIAESLFDQIIESVYQDKVYTDLDKSINKAYADLSKSITSETNIDIRHKILNFPKIAEKIKDENPEKAEALLKFVESYNNARTYDNLIAAVKTGKLRAKRIELEKFSRIANQYSARYANSDKIIDSIVNLPFIISRNINCTLEDAERIVVTYVKYIDYAKLSINKLQDYCFMYYFTKNIIGLDNYDESVFEEINFYNNVKKNLKLLLDAIHSIEDNIVNRK